jgi:uncharacterized protein
MKALPFEEEDESTDMVNNNMLDLEEVVRQSILLTLPIQPLCRPDCKGMCLTCGENLNMRKLIMNQEMKKVEDQA